MYLLNGTKSECCGCGACAQVCAHDCIRITPDEDGFLFPVIDKEKCVHCHLCEKVCPIEHIPFNEENQQGQVLVAATSKQEEHIMSASSGGAFGAIVKVLRHKERWFVWGAAFDKKLQLTHHCSENETDLAPLHKSKYLQSEMGDTFSQIKKQLAEGKNVLFSGTPCQVAALRNYLAKVNVDKLVCVDLICHGVPNQKLFDAYCEEEGKRFQSEVKSVQFRYKVYNRKLKKWSSRNMLLTTKDGKEHIQNRYNSRFLRAYHSFLFYRESCHSCVFATPSRQGDLTIADFWGIQRFYPQLDADKGVSLVQANTEKGKQILKQLGEEMLLYPVNREQYLKVTSGAMVKKTLRHRNRDAFLNDCRNHTFSESVDVYVPKYKEILKVELVRKLSPEMRKKIKKILRR